MKTAFALTLVAASWIVAPIPSVAAQPARASSGTSDRIEMADFRKLHAKDAVVVVDVRADSSYAAGHIPGAVSIPIDTITATVAQKLKASGKLVVPYCSCSSEQTSRRAVNILRDYGVNAQALVGGFIQWTNDKNPVVTGKSPR